MTPEAALLDALPHIRSMSRRAAFRFSLDADDLCQYTAMRVLNQIRNVRHADNLASLAVFMARRIVKSGVKRELSGFKGIERSHARIDDDADPIEIAAPERVVDTMALRQVCFIANALPLRQRDLYECVYKQDMSLAEYGEIRGLSQKTVWEAHEAMLSKMRAALGVEAPEKTGQGVRDDTVYTLISPDGQQLAMTRQQIQSRIGVALGDVSRLVTRKRKSCKGWRIAA